MTLATFQPKGATLPPADPTGCRDAVTEAILALQASHPRTLQRRLGPSEVGEECPRQLGYKLLNHPEVDARRIDQWPSFVGIAVHARIAQALDAWNLLNPGTWITEHRLTIPGVLDGGAGTGDAYYCPSFTTIDWKVLGDTAHRELVQNGPPRRYRAQGHIYGLGWAAMGYRVDWVAIGAFGRAKPLSGLHVWHERFDPAYAAAELERVRGVRRAADWIQANGADVRILPSVPGKSCYYCPFRGDPRHGFCEGDKT